MLKTGLIKIAREEFYIITGRPTKIIEKPMETDYLIGYKSDDQIIAAV